jgi:hypothetical protein
MVCQVADNNLLEHLSPLGWGHIKLTGDYLWSQNPVGML